MTKYARSLPAPVQKGRQEMPGAENNMQEEDTSNGKEEV